MPRTRRGPASALARKIMRQVEPERAQYARISPCNDAFDSHAAAKPREPLDRKWTAGQGVEDGTGSRGPQGAADCHLR